MWAESVLVVANVRVPIIQIWCRSYWCQ